MPRAKFKEFEAVAEQLLMTRAGTPMKALVTDVASALFEAYAQGIIQGHAERDNGTT